MSRRRLSFSRCTPPCIRSEKSKYSPAPPAPCPEHAAANGRPAASRQPEDAAHVWPVSNQPPRRLHWRQNQSCEYETKKIQTTQTEVISFGPQDIHKRESKINAQT